MIVHAHGAGLAVYVTVCGVDAGPHSKLWHELDEDKTNHISMRELEMFFKKSTKTPEQHPVFATMCCKTSLYRAFRATYADANIGNTNVRVERNEFAHLLLHVFYFDRLFKMFKLMDRCVEVVQLFCPQSTSAWSGR